jgi:hypothetical protein
MNIAEYARTLLRHNQVPTNVAWIKISCEPNDPVMEENPALPPTI